MQVQVLRVPYLTQSQCYQADRQSRARTCESSMSAQKLTFSVGFAEILKHLARGGE